MLVNAHEGESGTFKDRVLIETSPHALIEGAVITALGVNASHVVIALKREYRNAGIILAEAIESFREYMRAQNNQDILPPVSMVHVGGYLAQCTDYCCGDKTMEIRSFRVSSSDHSVPAVILY